MARHSPNQVLGYDAITRKRKLQDISGDTNSGPPPERYRIDIGTTSGPNPCTGIYGNQNRAGKQRKAWQRTAESAEMAVDTVPLDYIDPVLRDSATLPEGPLRNGVELPDGATLLESNECSTRDNVSVVSLCFRVNGNTSSPISGGDAEEFIDLTSQNEISPADTNQGIGVDSVLSQDLPMVEFMEPYMDPGTEEATDPIHPIDCTAPAHRAATLGGPS